ncbi:MAG TPA: hypothetical protein VEC02_04035 [Nitrososphaerales archaeon]|nr:hypothetical protein [Nitrososphaerales archaeon]
MKRERIIAEVETVSDARKVEETVKTGYVEALIETLVNWIGVEEDLVSSYERFASRQTNTQAKDVFQQLAKESGENVETLTDLKKSFEMLDKARISRIEQLSKMK